MKTKITLTDIMENDEFFNTSPRKNYIIKTPTGSGKTYFCINTLLAQVWPSGEKILFLANRTAVIRQVKENVREFAETQPIYYQRILSSIVISTYQRLEETLLNNGNMTIFDKNHYRYVICDEAHYFTHDSNFNPHTCLSFAWLTQKSRAITFFMSATIKCIEERLVEASMQCGPYIQDSSGYLFGKNKLLQIIDNIPADYSHIKPFCFDKITNIPALLKKLHGKTIIFVPSITEGDIIQNLLKNASISDVKFLSSEYRKNREKDELMQQLIVNECVNAKVLITTAIIDNGINLKDKNFQNAFVLTHTCEDLIQMLGRKRIVDDSHLNLFLCKRDTKYFYNVLKYYEDTRKVYEAYANYSPQYLLQLYHSSDDNCKNELDKLTYYCPPYVQSSVYSGLYFNPLSVDNLLQNIRNCKKIISRFETDSLAFIHMQLKWLDSSLIEKLQDTSTETLMPELTKLLEAYKGKKMKSDEIQKLIREEFQKYMIILFKSKKIYETTKVSKPQFQTFLKECVPSYQLCSEKPDGRTQQVWWIDDTTSENESGQ